ncbi:MAG TPA: hypothetical protein PKY56_00160 [Candidatus Kapabacteria bacterium]|nr:hypothetical protein [Candidatus Kapabacteria bacterium]
MGQITFNIIYRTNEGLFLSPFEVAEMFLYGITMTNNDGTKFSDEAIRMRILSAQKQVENYLSIKLIRQVYWENIDFIRTDYTQWGFFKTAYPVRSPLSLEGWIGTVRQIEYPISWASFHNTNDEENYFRTIHIVPVGTRTTTTPMAVVFSGITPHLGFMGVANIPNYWKVKYVTGFSKLVYPIVEAIGKLVAIQVLAVLGDIVLGAGISTKSLSFDGLSQSISSTNSGSSSAYGARIKQYTEELKNNMNDLRNYYKGISYMTC